MRVRHPFAVLGIIACLPCLNAEVLSLSAEFSQLQKRRVTQITEVVTPLDKKFTEAADVLAERALKQGDITLAEQIKRQRLPNTPAKYRLNPFEDTYWKTGEGTWISMYHLGVDGAGEETAYYRPTGVRTSGPEKWRMLEANKMVNQNGRIVSIQNGKLVSADGMIWTESDAATFRNYVAAKEMVEALRALNQAPKADASKPTDNTEFETLRNRHQAAVENAVAPIDRKFTVAADEIAVRAERQRDVDALAKIKSERVPKTTATLPSNRFENSFWKMNSGAYVSIYCFHAGGVLEEIAYEKGSGRPTGEKLKWQVTDDTHATVGKFSFVLENNVLSRNDGNKWTPADERLFKACAAAGDMKGMMAILANPTKAAEPGPDKPPVNPFGKRETPFGHD